MRLTQRPWTLQKTFYFRMILMVKGPYIKEWNVSGLDKPTDEQLAAQETAGNTEEANNTVRATRRAAYGDIGDQLDEMYKDIDALEG